MPDTALIELLSTFGFPAVVAFLLMWIVWKLGVKVVDANERMYNRTKSDSEKMAELHRTERKECYASHEKQVQKFDETIRLFANKS